VWRDPWCSAEQRDMLESRARARSASARSVERARIVLLAAGGMQDKQIPAKLRIMPEKAARWRNRFWTAGWRPGQRCATTGKTLDNHAGQDPGSGPENDAREAQQCHTLEHAQHGQSR
jgi:hypothetical protein